MTDKRSTIIMLKIQKKLERTVRRSTKSLIAAFCPRACFLSRLSNVIVSTSPTWRSESLTSVNESNREDKVDVELTWPTRSQNLVVEQDELACHS